MALPFAPKTLAEHKETYARAIVPLVDTAKGTLAGQPPIALQRDHVLDFADGLRLIVCKRQLGARLVVHIEGSAQPDTPCYALMGSGKNKRFVQLAEKRIQDMSGQRPLLMDMGYSNRIPHWSVPLVEEDVCALPPTDTAAVGDKLTPGT